MHRLSLSHSDRRCFRDVIVACRFLTLAAVALASLSPTTVAAQGNRTKVTYTVEFRTTGALLDRNCTATGTDVLTGTIVGYEPALPNEDNEYVGTLTRTTRITTCGSRRNAAGVDAVCSINYVGNGFADVMFTLHEGKRGAYLEYIPNRAEWAALLPPLPAGPVNSVVTGTCDPAELAQLQSEYAEGQTAGSPNGQPLEVSGFPPLSSRPTFPLTFPPTPPRSIWTLTVLDRRP
jgi:hypothetical protein